MVEGVQALTDKLTKQFPAAVQAAVKEAMERAATDVVAQMKARAPIYTGPETVRTDKRHKGQPIRPGALRDSIDWTWGNAPKGTVSLGSVRQSTFTGEGSLKITIFAGNKEAFYVRWAEFGTRKWLGNPFFFTTWRNNRSKVKGQMTRAVRKAIRASGMSDGT